MKEIIMVFLLGLILYLATDNEAMAITFKDGKINSESIIEEQEIQTESQPAKSALEAMQSIGEVNKRGQKEEVESVTWQMPRWCEDLEQKPNQIQVCGVALHKNLQMSRTRSEMDARKQLARRAAGQIDETIIEETSGTDTEVKSTTILTTKSKVGGYVIENQNTIPSKGKYLTFTKVVQFFE